MHAISLQMYHSLIVALLKNSSVSTDCVPMSGILLTAIVSTLTSSTKGIGLRVPVTLKVKAKKKKKKKKKIGMKHNMHICLSFSLNCVAQHGDYEYNPLQ